MYYSKGELSSLTAFVEYIHFTFFSYIILSVALFCIKNCIKNCWGYNYF